MDVCNWFAGTAITGKKRKTGTESSTMAESDEMYEGDENESPLSVDCFGSLLERYRHP